MNKEFIFSEFLLEKGFAYTNYGDRQVYELQKDKDLFSVNLESKTSTVNGKAFTLPIDEKTASKWFSDLGKLESVKE
jgi:phage antirepressor YoqD-like protein